MAATALVSKLYGSSRRYETAHSVRYDTARGTSQCGMWHVTSNGGTVPPPGRRAGPVPAVDERTSPLARPPAEVRPGSLRSTVRDRLSAQLSTTGCPAVRPTVRLSSSNGTIDRERRSPSRHGSGMWWSADLRSNSVSVSMCWVCQRVRPVVVYRELASGSSLSVDRDP